MNANFCLLIKLGINKVGKRVRRRKWKKKTSERENEKEILVCYFELLFLLFLLVMLPILLLLWMLLQYAELQMVLSVLVEAKREISQIMFD